MISVEIRDMGRPPGTNELKGMHHRAYTKLRNEWEMRLMVEQVPKIPTPCTLTVTVFSSGKMDLDNCSACAKIPLDCLQRLGLLEEDNTDHITRLTTLHQKSTRAEAGIRLDFYPIHATQTNPSAAHWMGSFIDDGSIA